MAKLRKMLGRVDAPQCIALMGQMEAQSHATLAGWAMDWAEAHCLTIYQSACPEDPRPREALAACRACLAGGMPKGEVKALQPLLKGLGEMARSAGAEGAAGEAAARALSAACGTIRTPQNALGFLFYAAAAEAYHQAGTGESPAEYDRLAQEHWQRALEDFGACARPEEPHPAKLNWHC